MSTLNIFQVLAATFTSTKIQIEGTVAFKCQQWLREHTKI